MSPVSQSERPKLEEYRPFLRLLAQLHWDERLQGRMEPSDLVQDTLEKAWKNLDQCRGQTEAEVAGWLRTSLIHNLIDAQRRVLGKGGDRAREIALLDVAMDDSSSRMRCVLKAEQSSPSGRAMRNEDYRRLEEALAALPPPQREAVTLHHLQGLPLAEVAGRLGRTEASVAGLLRRGLGKLREILEGPG